MDGKGGTLTTMNSMPTPRRAPQPSSQGRTDSSASSETLPIPFVRRAFDQHVLVAPRHAPGQIPADIAAITCYFNPCNYETPKRNFRRFVQGMHEQRVPFFVIELAFDQQPFFLRPNEVTLQLRGGDVLWQKERLLNILLDHVPEQFTKIAWIDADMEFENPEWACEASQCLNEFSVVQLFDQCFHLSKCGDVESVCNGVAYAVQHGIRNANNLGIAHPGFAWAARRDLLHRHGLLDTNIVGGGDSLMVLAMYGWWDHSNVRKYNPAMREVWRTWAEPIWREVRGHVGYVPGRVRHLWHGTRVNRRYTERVYCLTRNNFDPRTDIGLDDSGLWRWTSDKPSLHQEVKRYFWNRREDQ
jgi:hypothetical protein